MPPKPPGARRKRRPRKARPPRVERVRGLATVESEELREKLKVGKGEEVFVQDLPNKLGFCAVFVSGGTSYFPVHNGDVKLLPVDKDAEYEALKAARRALATGGSEPEEGWEPEDTDGGYEELGDEELLGYALGTALGEEDEEGYLDVEEAEDDGLMDLPEAPDDEEEAVSDIPPWEDDEDYDEDGNLVSDDEKKLRRVSKVRDKVLKHGEGPKTKPLFASKRSGAGWARVEVDPGREKPYDVKDQLKALRFRWDNEGRVWWKRVRDGQIDELSEKIEELGCKPKVKL